MKKFFAFILALTLATGLIPAAYAVEHMHDEQDEEIAMVSNAEETTADECVCANEHHTHDSPRLDRLSSEKFISKNLALTAHFVDSEYVYKIGLFTNVESARFIIGRQCPLFEELCSDPETIKSLEKLLETEEEEYIRLLLSVWLEYLQNQFGVATRLTLTPYHVAHSVTLPGGKILQGYRYTGTSLPTNTYPGVTAIHPRSYHYNCVSYAWYLHGNIYSHSPQMVFNQSNDSNRFRACAGDAHATPKVGDIVVYTQFSNGFDIAELHSGIVTSISGSNVYVKSKWGWQGVYSHEVKNCDYWAPTITIGNNSNGVRLDYYTLKHSYILHNGYYHCKGCGYKNPVPVNGGVEHEEQ